MNRAGVEFRCTYRGVAYYRVTDAEGRTTDDIAHYFWPAETYRKEYAPAAWNGTAEDYDRDVVARAGRYFVGRYGPEASPEIAQAIVAWNVAQGRVQA